MKKRSIIILAISTLLAFGLCFEGLAVNTQAVARSKSDTSGTEDTVDAAADEVADPDDEPMDTVDSPDDIDEGDDVLAEDDEEDTSSSKSSKSSSKTSGNSSSKSSTKSSNSKSSSTSDEETDADADTDSDSSDSKSSNKKSSNSKTSTSKDTASDTSDSKSSAKTSTSKTSTSKTSTTKSSSKSSESATDANGNKILMTEKQRRARFMSKTNPKRGTKPATIARPASNGFAYADFATFNSYNSENGLGGTPIYLLGTIMDIEKAKEDQINYHCVLAVNDCDGYQWYVRANVQKAMYDQYRAMYIGKAAYMYGLYSGYSGVTNRPMMDVTLIVVTAAAPAAGLNPVPTANAANTVNAAAAGASTRNPSTSQDTSQSLADQTAANTQTSSKTASASSGSAGSGGGDSNFNTYDNASQQNTSDKYVLNTDSKKIHHPSCNDVRKIAPDNYQTTNSSLEELEAQGYTVCGHCFS